MQHSSELQKRVRDLRERAARARYIALGLSQDADRQRLQEFAADLDRQADELEQHAKEQGPGAA
jgi:hypothetical protein